MAKTYSKKNVIKEDLKPKKEVVSFIINYSKALNIIKVKDKSIEVISN